ncbi:flagellin N-terminal helical domain-containing protein [Aquipseudomonas ullengensis]|uniref:Flagellin n=1 Tax=Aquipseudomonas ullengensis TaxID=2759166 RepID=A0A7W4LPG6_9GAMM|nr:flagellin [Pseudomonas ullengensis]MBB2496762.1 flagellin [Pseudomonas ullengensis]
MALTLNTNVSSMSIQRAMNETSRALAVSMQRLSTGFRINSAKDDAAGLQISNRLSSQISGFGVAIRNANDGISLAQTAEGALQQSTSILQRMRELALQSANGSNGASERSAINEEVAQLQQELSRIAETTTFGGRKLLNGSFGSSAFQVGANAFEAIGIGLGNYGSAALGSNTRDLVSGTAGSASNDQLGGLLQQTGAIPANLVSGDLTVSGRKASTFAVEGSAKSVARAINLRQDTTGVTADARTLLQLSFSEDDTYTFDLYGANSKAVQIHASIEDGDLGSLVEAINDQSITTGITASIKDGQLLLTSEAGDDIVLDAFQSEQAGTAQAQSLDYTGEEALTAAVATLTDTSALRAIGVVRLSSGESFSVQASAATIDGSVSNNFSSLQRISEVDLRSDIGAQTALGVIDGALEMIDSARAEMGAVQNRLDFTIANLMNMSENLSAARSRIRDTDYASEMSELVRNQILQQAQTAMLAQANQQPQLILTLLQSI